MLNAPNQSKYDNALSCAPVMCKQEYLRFDATNKGQAINETVSIDIIFRLNTRCVLSAAVLRSHQAASNSVLVTAYNEVEMDPVLRAIASR